MSMRRDIGNQVRSLIKECGMLFRRCFASTDVKTDRKVTPIGFGVTPISFTQLLELHAESLRDPVPIYKQASYSRRG
jgi:hypothetical protein